MKTTEFIQIFRAKKGLIFGVWTKRSAMALTVAIPASAAVLVA